MNVAKSRRYSVKVADFVGKKGRRTLFIRSSAGRNRVITDRPGPRASDGSGKGVSVSDGAVPN